MHDLSAMQKDDPVPKTPLPGVTRSEDPSLRVNDLPVTRKHFSEGPTGPEKIRQLPLNESSLHLSLEILKMLAAMVPRKQRPMNAACL
jgi:hypothetical protein